MADAFGNALGNSIVGAIQQGQEQRKLEDSFKKAGVAYGYDQNGKVVAQSQSTQAAAEALLRSGASLKDMVTVLGDEGIQGAFDGVDQANAYLASNPDRLQAAFDDFAGTSPAGVQQSGPSAFVDADGILNITVTGENPNAGLVAALSAVTPVAGALADLADRSLVAAEFLVAAGQAAIGGGGVGQAIKQVGRIAAGQVFEQLQDRAAEYVSARVSEYFTNNSGLDATEISLLSAGAGFGTNLVLGSILGVKSSQVIVDARNVRGVLENKRKGDAFEQQVGAYKRDTQDDYMEQISIKPNTANGPANFRVRADGVGRERGSGRILPTDAKASDTAGLTPGQKQGYPLIEQYGGTVVGKKGGTTYPAGTQIPPGTTVEIVRPDDLPPGY